jgi:beta-glucosidase-like glycosyl hydrolase
MSGMSVANLVVPAIRWDPVHGYANARPVIERGLELGVGGFILFGGEQDAVRQLTKELRSRSRVPLLIAADLERGVGQQIAGATGLPPLAAIASLNDPDAVRRAGRLTAREARTLGINWDYAPVCDVDLAPDNPVLGTRSFGSDPHRVASLAATWIRACQAEGVLACAKHFPGHGRTHTDSHHELPVVEASRRELLEVDLLPFRVAIEAGVASIMTAHVAYPALDVSGVPATMSREILQWLLRQQMRFDGLIVTDALVMGGALAGRSEEEAAVAALQAGCDLLLCPRDLEAVIRALERALEAHELSAEQVQQSLRRRLKWAQWASPPNEYRKPSAADIAWGAQLADRVVRMVRGVRPPLRPPLEVVVIDDDVGDPPPPPRDPFLATLTHGGWEVRRVPAPTGEPGRATLIALFGEARPWKGRAGYAPETRAAVERACAAAPDALVMQFGHPRLIRELPAARAIATAWGGEPAMQQAAARWLLRA